MRVFSEYFSQKDTSFNPCSEEDNRSKVNSSNGRITEKEHLIGILKETGSLEKGEVLEKAGNIEVEKLSEDEHVRSKKQLRSENNSK